MQSKLSPLLFFPFALLLMLSLSHCKESNREASEAELIKLLLDSDQWDNTRNDRLNAIDALAKSTSAEAIDALLFTLKQDESGAARILASEALGKMQPTKKLADALMDIWRDRQFKDADVRNLAVQEAFLGFGDSAIPFLLEGVNSDEPIIQLQSMRTLELSPLWADRKDVYEAVLKLKDSPDIIISFEAEDFVESYKERNERIQD